MSISHVSFEHHVKPLGIGEAEPRLSWRFDGDADDWIQGGYDVEISREQTELFQFNGSDSVLVPWPSVALESSEAAKVRVRAHGSDGQPDTEWSQSFVVETGLLSQEGWKDALMISSEKNTTVDIPKQPILLRKEFSIDGDIESARLYITAYGIYEAQLNGQRVGDLYLAPGWQSYKTRLVYDTYDVTDLVTSGQNAIGVQVGEGWWAGRLGYNGGDRNIWGDTPGAMSLLVVTKTDGTEEVVITDDTWESGFGPIITSEIYDGEQYDARLDEPGWSEIGFTPLNSTNWSGTKILESPLAQLVAPDGPPVRRIEEVQIKEVLQSASGKTILDFGQNLVGWLHVQIAGPEGTTIKFVHTEGM